MPATVHFELELLGDTLVQPLCENQSGVDAFDCTDDVEMSPDEAEVTCPRCLEALGYSAEQLTECLPDPLRRAAA